MRPEKAPVQLHRDDAIRLWQAQADAGKDVILSGGIIASLFDGLMDFMKTMLKQLRNRGPRIPQYQALEKSAAALLFWGRDFGVSDGELDMRLQYASGLRDTILTILTAIGECMRGGLVRIIPVAEERQELLRNSNIVPLLDSVQAALDEPLQRSDYSDYDAEELCSTLQSRIECLGTLDSSLECPAEDESDEEELMISGYIPDRLAHEYYVDLVVSRFPKADKALVESLGRSNWNRYNHLRKLREDANQPVVEVAAVGDAKSLFHDSGIGTSVSAESVIGSHDCQTRPADYAATVVSSRAEASHRRLPRLPEEARSGKPFKCDICDRTILVRRTNEWKKHVFTDICAYTCIFNECPSTGVLFENREVMTAHLESQHGMNEHSQLVACPLCFDPVSGGCNLISLHFARHMEEVALSVLPRTTESDNGSEESSNTSELGQDSAPSPLSEAQPQLEANSLPPPSWGHFQDVLAHSREGQDHSSVSMGLMSHSLAKGPLLEEVNSASSKPRPANNVGDPLKLNCVQCLDCAAERRYWYFKTYEDLEAHLVEHHAENYPDIESTKSKMPMKGREGPVLKPIPITSRPDPFDKDVMFSTDGLSSNT